VRTMSEYTGRGPTKALTYIKNAWRSRGPDISRTQRDVGGDV
jgi:hypothetical protein